MEILLALDPFDQGAVNPHLEFLAAPPANLDNRAGVRDPAEDHRLDRNRLPGRGPAILDVRLPCLLQLPSGSDSESTRSTRSRTATILSSMRRLIDDSGAACLCSFRRWW